MNKMRELNYAIKKYVVSLSVRGSIVVMCIHYECRQVIELIPLSSSSNVIAIFWVFHSRHHLHHTMDCCFVFARFFVVVVLYISINLKTFHSLVSNILQFTKQQLEINDCYLSKNDRKPKRNRIRGHHQ